MPSNLSLIPAIVWRLPLLGDHCQLRGDNRSPLTVRCAAVQAPNLDLRLLHRAAHPGGGSSPSPTHAHVHAVIGTRGKINGSIVISRYNRLNDVQVIETPRAPWCGRDPATKRECNWQETLLSGSSGVFYCWVHMRGVMEMCTVCGSLCESSRGSQ